ncbi:hypothetical protein B4U79_01804, partial [Dinothrombium tinctorium]
HNFGAPYHPRTNGEAERFVRTFKEAMRIKSERGLHHQLVNFLFDYRKTPHSSTNRTPSEMMLGRQIRCLLDLLRPDVRKDFREFDIGTEVWVQDFGPNRSFRWRKGIVRGRTGPVSYKVEVEKQIWKRHDEDWNAEVEDNFPIDGEQNEEKLQQSEQNDQAESSQETMTEQETERQVPPDRERRYPLRNRKPTREISEQQVKKCIFKQSSFEAVGVDEINGYMLKLSCEYIAPHITTLINCIIKSGKYPAKWKIARVFPVYKNRGSKYDKSNYGPISILSSMSKIMKNYLHDIISNHLENQKLISPNQYGFQKGKST